MENQEALERDENDTGDVRGGLEERLEAVRRQAAMLQQMEAELKKSMADLESRQARTAAAEAQRRQEEARRQQEEARRQQEEALARQRQEELASKQRLARGSAIGHHDEQVTFVDHGASAEPSGAERRIFARYAASFRVTFSSAHNFYAGISENISEGGVFIATFEAFAIGTPLALTMTLPNDHEVRLNGVVRWCREYNPSTPNIQPGVGVQFTELDGETRAAIDEFVAHRATLLYEC